MRKQCPPRAFAGVHELPQLLELGWRWGARSRRACRCAVRAMPCGSAIPRGGDVDEVHVIGRAEFLVRLVTSGVDGRTATGLRFHGLGSALGVVGHDVAHRGDDRAPGRRSNRTACPCRGCPGRSVRCGPRRSGRTVLRSWSVVRGPVVGLRRCWSPRWRGWRPLAATTPAAKPTLCRNDLRLGLTSTMNSPR
jgi:hypothetical protein